MDIGIRLARISDVPDLLDLYKLLNTGSEPELTLEYAWARFLDLSSSPRHQIYVAEAGEQILGTFSLIFVGGMSHGARDACTVEDVVVAAEMQGRGIGKKMMAFAMAECERRDCYKLVLSSHVQRGAAHRFYENLGFRKHGFSFLIGEGGPTAAHH